MRVLVVNAGSSSLKLRLLDGADELVRIARSDRGRRRVSTATSSRASLHGWPRAGRGRPPGRARRDRSSRSAVRDRRARSTRAAACPDRPGAAAPAEVARRRSTRCADVLPDVPAVACFDTAFHATLPAAAATYAVPARVARAVRRPPLRLPRAVPRLLLAPRRRARRPTASTGCGSSPATSAPARRCARCVDGRSVDTTMGFTPLEGLVMATRSGQRRPRAGAVAARSTRACAPHEVATALEQPLRPARRWPGPPTCARSTRAAARRSRGDAGARRLPARRWSPASRAMAAAARRARRAGVHRRRRRALATCVRAEAARRLGWLGVAIDGCGQPLGDRRRRHQRERTRACAPSS